MRVTFAVVGLALLTSCGDSKEATPVSPSPAPTSAPATAPDLRASYRVTFEATWSSATHPNMFPETPHFSGLIGATHENGFRLWQEGSIASNGIPVGTFTFRRQ